MTLIQVLKRFKTTGSLQAKVKRVRLTATQATADPESPEDSFNMSPELKVGDFLSGDYTREIELKSELLRDICALWKSKDMTDVTIECEDGPIKAHKLLLSGKIP
jgi:hypothetical protein